jgi:hypothetical protein
MAIPYKLMATFFLTTLPSFIQFNYLVTCYDPYFRRFWRENGVFLEPQCNGRLTRQNSSNWSKSAIFSPIFSAKLLLKS